MNKYDSSLKGEVGSPNSPFLPYDNDVLSASSSCAAATTAVCKYTRSKESNNLYHNSSASCSGICAVPQKISLKNDVSSTAQYNHHVAAQLLQQTVDSVNSAAAVATTAKNGSAKSYYHRKWQQRKWGGKKLKCNKKHGRHRQQCNLCFPNRTTLNMSTTKQHDQKHSFPLSPFNSTIIDPMFDRKTYYSSSNTNEVVPKNSVDYILYGLPKKRNSAEIQNVDEHGTYIASVSSTMSSSVSLRTSPATTPSSPTSFLSFIEDNIIIPPPMLFIPIVMPPLLHNTTTSIALHPMSIPSIRIHRHHHHQLQCHHKDQELRQDKLTKEEKEKEVVKNKPSFRERIKWRRKSTYIPRNRVKVDINRLQRHRRIFIWNWLEMMIKFSTATVGRKLNTVQDKHNYKYHPSAAINRLVHGFDPIQLQIEQDDYTHHRDINPSSMEQIRRTYEVQNKQGSLKKTDFQVTFEYPHSAKECCGCEGKDFVYLIIGLINIFVLQFIMVVLLFFAKHEQR